MNRETSSLAQQKPSFKGRLYHLCTIFIFYSLKEEIVIIMDLYSTSGIGIIIYNT